MTDYNTFFGEPWPSSICELLTQGDTPVGKECMFCEEPIVEGDRGSWVQGFALSETGPAQIWAPAHRECQLRQFVGGPAHLAGRCSCYNGPGMTEREAAMSAREEALWVWELWTRREAARRN